MIVEEEAENLELFSTEAFIPEPKKKRKPRKKREPKSDRETYGDLPFEVQEVYQERMWPKGYTSSSHRGQAFANAKDFVKTCLQFGFDDPVDVMKIICRSIADEMVNWPTNFRTPTIATLAKRINGIARARTA